MRVSNEAIVNVTLDPALQIKRYEKDIRDLKQELAMHDTLANRGRINYGSYDEKETEEIQKNAMAFLSGDLAEFADMDSLHKVREYMN